MLDDAFFGIIIAIVIILIVSAIGFDIYLYFHCWGLPLDNQLPFECFNNGFYSVINNS